MDLREVLKEIRYSAPVNAVKGLLEWKLFPFITAVAVLFCYYLGWDLAIIYYMAVCGILVLLLLDDVTPLISLFLFMNVMISRQHSPSVTVGASDYYLQPVIYIQIIILISLYALAAFAKIAVSINKGNFKATPTFFGLCVFALTLVFNGVFSENYNPMNALFGACLAFLFLGIFTLGGGNIKVNSSTYERIAYGFLALSVLLIIELSVAYATYEDLIVDGTIERWRLSFGWGIYNTMGMLMTISIPSVFYLAGKYRYGWLFTLYSLILLAAAFLTLSRQAIVGSTVIYICCAALLVAKGKNRLINCGIFAAAAVAVTIFVIVKREIVATLFATIITQLGDGSGRLNAYRAALENFSKFPVFGMGFYVPIPEDPGFVGLEFIPLMYHNTIMQLMGACGAVATVAYAVHRTQTVISFIKNITLGRTYIAITICALLIVNLFDNHLFYLLPTLVYSMLVAVLINSESEGKGALIRNRAQ